MRTILVIFSRPKQVRITYNVCYVFTVKLDAFTKNGLKKPNYNLTL